ncbi:MAG TPA: SdrD B-like domain-containing protein, partial [Myxococcota bacterium]
TTPAGTTLVSNTSDATGVHLLFDTLALGQQITITYSAVLNGPEDVGFVIPTPGSTVTNTAVVNWDHLPGPGGRTGTDDDPASITVNNNAISGYVYRDDNNNGLRDDTVNLSGVRIELYDSATNALLAFTTTNASGYYEFLQLRPGSYYIVQPTQPTGLLDGKEQAGNVGTTFGGSTGPNQGVGSDRIANIVIPADSNTTQPNYNFGELLPGSIGNFVWHDVNGNGRQDGGVETGVQNATVTLTWTGLDGIAGNADDVVFSTVTDASGAYSFGPGSTVTVVSGTYFGVTAGNTVTLAGLYPANFGQTNNYRVTFTPPVGSQYVFTTADSNAATDATDSDVTNIVTGATAPVTIAYNASNPLSLNNPTIDAGLYIPVAVGDTVWQDRNADGIRQPGELGLQGVTVQITWLGTDGAVGGTGTNADVTYTAVTDANGNYSITGLPPGVHTATVVTTTGQLAGGGFTRTFDRDDGTGPFTTPNNSGLVFVGSGTTDNNFDFGYRGGASIGDFVWQDLDADGVQDVGEPGIPGATVTLVGAGLDGLFGTADDQTYPSLVTDATGHYTFGNLIAGNYRVSVDPTSLPVGAIQTYDLNGPLNNSADRTLAANENATNLDFGYRGTGSIGDFVWNDRDGDAAQDANEPGIPGVTVQLTAAGLDGVLGTADDLVYASQVTNSSGGYLFSNLLTGLYRVDVLDASVPSGLVLTTANDFTDVSLGNGQNRLDVDFGYQGPGSIGDTVWFDQNSNGVQDAGEPGIANVDLTIRWAGKDGILGNADDALYTAQTDSLGKYNLTGLPLGTFSVTVDTADLPTGLTTPTWDFNDQGGTVATPNTANNIVLTVGDPNEDRADFGYRGTGSIGDYVWQDLDADGNQDAFEPAMPGVTVELRGHGVDGVPNTADDLLITTTTDANGLYNFDNLPPGVYTVTVIAATLPGSAVQTYDLDGLGSANNATLTLGNGETRNDVDFGYRGQGSIGDYIWQDRDADGVQDAFEPAIPGATVNLIGAGLDGLLGTADDLIYASTTTDANGLYKFDFLVAGLYRVSVDPASLPGGAVQTYDLDGIGGASANRADVTLGAAQNRTDVDFGYRGTASLGDYVWQDLDADGVQDSGEPALPGVKVDLYSAGLDSVLGTADDLVYASTTTDAAGLYTFGNLLAGDYRVAIDVSTLPAGAIQTFDLDGLATANRADRTLTAGETATDVDFGYRGTGSIGDFVWNDRDGDAVQDANEPGIAGVTVQLTMAGLDGVLGTADDLSYTAQVTNSAGGYLFSNLLTGLYRVDVIDSTVTLNNAGDPTGLVLTTANDFTDVSLGNGQNRLDVDFGYQGPGSIGDTVWFDQNSNGVQDAGEPGIANVDLTITWAGKDGVLGNADDAVYTVQTDSLGKYNLTG